MFVIRREQTEAFRPAMMKSFECRVYAHLLRVFPEDCQVLGEEACRIRIRKGIQAAGEYGITIEYDVVRYIDLMFFMCEDFDKSPDVPWAARILGLKDLHPTEKVDRLYERLNQEMKAFSRT